MLHLRHRIGVLVLALLCLSLWFPTEVEARPGWDRDVGHRLTKHPNRNDRKRLHLTQKIRDVSFTATQATKQIQALQRDPNVKVKLLGRGEFGNPIYRIDVPTSSHGKKSKVRGKPPKKPLRVVVSSWLHGNEPAGPAAAFKLVERARKDRGFRQRFDLSVLVKVDPWLRRENPAGQDLNRAFAPGRWTAESRAIKRSLAPELRSGSIDLFVDLHGAKRNGFFQIRGDDDGKLSRRILGAMESGALLDAKPHKPQVGPYKLHALGGAFTTTNGTFKAWMTKQGVPYSYTLEAPRRLAPKRQVSGMFKLLRSTLDNTAKYGRFR